MWNVRLCSVSPLTGVFPRQVRDPDGAGAGAGAGRRQGVHRAAQTAHRDGHQEHPPPAGLRLRHTGGQSSTDVCRCITEMDPGIRVQAAGSRSYVLIRVIQNYTDLDKLSCSELIWFPGS